MDQQLCMDYPLRPGFLAQVVIPRNLTKLEADKLCAFVQTLVQPETQDDKAEG